MSHDHLQFVHLMMRHRDKNLNLDGMNQDVNHRMKVDLTHLHRENHLMTVCLKKDDRMKI
jgi:hypothetical protein